MWFGKKANPNIVVTANNFITNIAHITITKGMVLNTNDTTTKAYCGIISAICSI